MNAAAAGVVGKGDQGAVLVGIELGCVGQLADACFVVCKILLHEFQCLVLCERGFDASTVFSLGAVVSVALTSVSKSLESRKVIFHTDSYIAVNLVVVAVVSKGFFAFQQLDGSIVDRSRSSFDQGRLLDWGSEGSNSQEGGQKRSLHDDQSCEVKTTSTKISIYGVKLYRKD